jgi:hypothetical protein
METPFDSLLFGLRQSMFHSLQRKAPLSEVFSVVYSFSRIARVLYLNMFDASEKLHVFLDTRNKQRFPGTPTLEEIQEREDGPIRCRLSYIQFIEHINRTGRVLKLKRFPPPLYGRIYFFRNIMVEHWDRYLQFLSNGEGLISTGGRILIPYALDGIIVNDVRSALQQELTDEFAKCGVTLPSLDGKWYGVYSDIIYTSLEAIDPELRRHNEKKKFGIPESLVISLFKYSFPTPICDMEEYCKTLVAWMETLPLQ